MVSRSRSAGLRHHRAHAASQPRMPQRCLSCSMSFLLSAIRQGLSIVVGFARHETVDGRQLAFG